MAIAHNGSYIYVKVMPTVCVTNLQGFVKGKVIVSLLYIMEAMIRFYVYGIDSRV